MGDEIKVISIQEVDDTLIQIDFLNLDKNEKYCSFINRDSFFSMISDFENKNEKE